jgi:hypothetical protein
MNECPISRALFHPAGLATNARNDPNAALWRSIRPGAPPSWPARLRERGAAFRRQVLSQRSARRWLVGCPSAQDALSSAAFGLVIGLATGLAVRPIIAELSALARATGPRPPIVRVAPRVASAPPAASRARLRLSDALDAACAIEVSNTAVSRAAEWHAR